MLVSILHEVQETPLTTNVLVGMRPALFFNGQLLAGIKNIYDQYIEPAI